MSLANLVDGNDVVGCNCHQRHIIVPESDQKIETDAIRVNFALRMAL